MLNSEIFMILRIKDLSYDVKVGGLLKEKTYRIIDNFNLNVERGESITIYGDRYSGKYYLIRMLTKMMKPTKGEVIYRGVNILSLSKKKLYNVRRSIQTIFQDPIGMFNERLSVYDNIKWFGDVAEVEDCLWIVSDIINRFIGANLKEVYPNHLSFLERQIVSIARSMMLKPEILLLENPTLFIDWNDKDYFIKFLNYLNEEYDLTIIVFSSDLTLLRKYGDRAGVLHMGRLIELGDREEIVNRPRHPYTKLLMETDERILDAEDLSELSHDILNKYVDGCRFLACKYRSNECDRLEMTDNGRSFVKCVLYK